MEKDVGFQQGMGHASFRSYTIGFLISLIFNLVSYGLVVYQLLSGLSLHLTLATFALLQALLQMILYLDLGREEKPRWNLIMFLFMVLVTVIVVYGSLWIMNHLNYNLMPHGTAN